MRKDNQLNRSESKKIALTEFSSEESKEKKEKRKISRFTVFALIIVIIAGSLAALAAIYRISRAEDMFANSGIRIESLHLIIGLVGVVAFMLLVIMIATLFNRLLARKEEDPSAKTIIVSGEEKEEEREESGERFCMLSQIDRERERYEKKGYEQGVSFEYFCDSFRNYVANELKLYYTEDDIRKFVASLATSKMLILQGMSGTGKTSLAHALGSFVDNPSTVIPVQPVWKERSDLIGYYNEFTKRFNETQLLEKMYEANYSKDIYVTVLDEMNIARVEYYFAEFLSLLELPDPDERYLDVVSDKWDNDPIQLKDGRIKLPQNMWFIGTANNDDSTFAISDKVYDRAMVIDLERKSEAFAAPKSEKIRISAEQFEKMRVGALREYAISRRNAKRLAELDAYMIEKYHITFGNRIMKQIKEYVPVYIACGGRELDALDDILAKKVMRKLESQNPIYFKNTANELLLYLDELFGEDEMKNCREYITRIRRNA